MRFTGVADSGAAMSAASGFIIAGACTCLGSAVAAATSTTSPLPITP